jgi:flagellar biosynthesis protein FlhF
MIVKKFFANTSRQALHLVRQDLGPDALILSNRAVDNGMEILAVAQGDLPLQEGADMAAAPASAVKAKPRAKARSSARVVKPAVSAAVAAVPAQDPIPNSLVHEMRSMRGLLEQQLVYQAWETAQRRGPGKARVLRDMLHSGFSAALVRQFLEKMPPGLPEEQNFGWVRAVLERNLRTVPAAEDIVERGGTYALVGPTGVGKTTTVAKIAARGVVRYGAEKIALLSTDSYRIGAHEQLRIYGKLLGVRVIAVKDASDLQFVLEDLRNKHLVLIDTVGMGQRDQMVAEQLSLLSAAGTDVKRLLLLNSTGNGETLDEVVNVYREGGVHGCIITKTDEAVGIATVLDVAIRQKLPLHYVTDGQRVPEDLHRPDKDSLLQRALNPVSASSVHHLDATECQLMLATAPSGGWSEGVNLG